MELSSREHANTANRAPFCRRSHAWVKYQLDNSRLDPRGNLKKEVEHPNRIRFELVGIVYRVIFGSENPRIMNGIHHEQLISIEAKPN
jgi:hypothetical protein